MRIRLLTLGSALLVASCSGSVDVDAAAAIPGSWLYDDGIVITFDNDGSYEWRVPDEMEWQADF